MSNKTMKPLNYLEDPHLSKKTKEFCKDSKCGR